MSHRLSMVIALAPIVALPSLCSAASYTVTDLGSLGGFSYGYGINNSGQVVGPANLSGNLQQHAFLYDGTMHDLGTLGGGSSGAYGMNDSGQITGYANTSGNAAAHAFLYDGTMHDLGTLGGRDSVGNSVNSSGQIAGTSQTSGDSADHAFF